MFMSHALRAHRATRDGAEAKTRWETNEEESSTGSKRRREWWIKMERERGANRRRNIFSNIFGNMQE